MAASAKRKQEEKHLKMLREMTSLPPNRKCFDCDQRGPTYANMTVGSFVCTSCSGILRGLNPPHRVKSISMTTFTQQEIEFLQKHGNEVCKQIWLGLYDDRTSAIPDFREPQKVKEFLQEKYEKKRWYVPPEQAKVVASVHASISGSSASSTSSTPEVRPLKTLLGETAPTLHLSRNTPSQSPVVSRTQLTQQDRKFDLLSDLGGDIFAAPSSQSPGGANFANFAHFNSHPASQNANASADFANFDAFGSPAAAAAAPPSAAFPQAPQQASFQPAQTGGSSGLANANFANFDNFPKSCSADFASYSSSQTNCTGGGAKAEGSAVPADRYAALADLDNIFSSVKPDQGTGSGSSGASSAPPSAGVGPPPPQAAMLGGDRYAALAALDNVFSSPSSTTSSFNTVTNTQGTVFGASTGVSASQPQQGSLPSMPQGFTGPSTNPFVAPAVPQAAVPTNPFQTNGRAVAGAASFGPGSMSMPAGFGNAAAYNLPTSFSGSFQQAFPSQGFPQQQTYPQQPNGGGFAAFGGQGKAVVPPFGQNMASTGVTNNPFLAGAPAGQYPAGNSSTNPFL
ncbi:arf-GAP domain and FG repeat-containing protein 1a isoform X5 [Colossoma macropomum]|uniref:arf-GAP domain and FG repeat-containing protein 1a isoform X5 n=1 Tax=Colossoma macropomum TaxID=42526 RepID=UPI001864AA17|nr:arf-GAP domain and FG repeat-containing protein 1a isoform X5 [Colossoma macropomum]